MTFVILISILWLKCIEKVGGSYGRKKGKKRQPGKRQRIQQREQQQKQQQKQQRKRTTRTKAAAKEDFRIGELDQYLFSMGTHYDIYKKMGAHEAVMNGKKGVYFAVWAPNAATVSVIGEFNGWREEANPMTRLEPSGIYEGFVVGAKSGYAL